MATSGILSHVGGDDFAHSHAKITIVGVGQVGRQLNFLMPSVILLVTIE
jgi:hypothetical protein